MLSFECIKNEKSVYFLLTSAVCRELGSSSAEKKLAVQNLPREKLFKRELGSRRHYGYENAQKQASCERCLSGIGQSPRNQTTNYPKLEEMRYI